MEPITFNRGILRPYMKGRISCDQNLIQVEQPTALLGFIPTGHRSYQLPLAQVASVISIKNTHWVALVFLALMLLGTGLPMIGENLLGGILLCAVYVWLMLVCLPGQLVIATTAGQEARITFTFFERDKAVLAAQRLNRMIANRMDDTNVRMNTDRVVEAIHNKS